MPCIDAIRSLRRRAVAGIGAVDGGRGEGGGMLRYFILGLFRSGQAYYGYALMKEYRERAGMWVSSAVFYPELQRLVAEGWIEKAGGADADPRRACYAITDAGAATFDAWLAAPLDAADLQPEDDISARALFLAEVAPREVEAQLDRWRQELRFCSKMLDRAREHGCGAAARGDGEFLLPLEVLFARRLKQIAADLDFVDRFQAKFSEWSRTAAGASAQGPRSRPVSQEEEPASFVAEREPEF